MSHRLQTARKNVPPSKRCAQIFHSTSLADSKVEYASFNSLFTLYLFIILFQLESIIAIIFFDPTTLQKFLLYFK